jgi:CheY-like chemotaxis protein
MNTEHLKTLAHDIRNPLASILSSVEMLRVRPVAEHEANRLLHIIENKVYIISHVLDTLYDIAPQERIGAKDADAHASESADSAQQSSKKTYTLLLVDDNKTSVDVLAELLRMRGHTVHVAYTGAGAHEQVALHTPDIAVLDIGLPDVDGYTLLASLRTAATIPHAIALTGYDREEDKLKALAAGFNHYLRKPVGVEALEKVIKRVVREEK